MRWGVGGGINAVRVGVGKGGWFGIIFYLFSLIKEGKLLKRPSVVVELVPGAGRPETVKQDHTKGVFSFEHINI